MKKPRTCLECVWLVVDYEGDYSDITPDDGFTLECLKSRFSRLCCRDNRALYRENLYKAPDCEEFAPHEEKE